MSLFLLNVLGKKYYFFPLLVLLFLLFFVVTPSPSFLFLGLVWFCLVWSGLVCFSLECFYFFGGIGFLCCRELSH